MEKHQRAADTEQAGKPHKLHIMVCHAGEARLMFDGTMLHDFKRTGKNTDGHRHGRTMQASKKIKKPQHKCLCKGTHCLVCSTVTRWTPDTFTTHHVLIHDIHCPHIRQSCQVVRTLLCATHSRMVLLQKENRLEIQDTVRSAGRTLTQAVGSSQNLREECYGATGVGRKGDRRHMNREPRPKNVFCRASGCQAEQCSRQSPGLCYVGVAKWKDTSRADGTGNYKHRLLDASKCR